MPRASQRWLAWVCVTGAAVFAASARDGLAQAAKASEPEPKRVERPADEARLAAVAKSLEMRLDADFVDAPLKDVVAFLSSKAGVRVVLDQRAIEGAGFGTDTPVTFSHKQLPLRSLLNLMLQRYELTWVAQPGGIRVTSLDECANHVQTMVLNVADLIRPGSPRKEERAASLLAVIQSHTGMPSPGWINDGGMGQIDLTAEGALIVSTAWPVRSDIEALVEAVRGEARRIAKKSDWKPAVISSPAEQSHADIRAKLDALTSFDFVDAPLRDVCAFVSDQHGLPIHLDQRGLENAGFGIDTPVTINAANAPLGESLHELLGGLNLTFIVRDDVVFVTSREESTARLRWRLYAVADLASSEDDEEAAEQLDELKHLLQSHTGSPAPGWTDDGGPGTISPLTLARSLVVSTTDEAHGEVSRLLSEIRRTRSFAASPPSPPVYEQRSYRLVKTGEGQPVIDPAALLLLIRDSLPKEQWKSEPRQVGELFILDQTPRGHRDIQRAMQRLGIPLFPNSGGFGGGLGGGGMGGGGGFF